MHDGFKVVHVDLDNTPQAKTAVRFDAHESLAYGCDWAFSDDKEEEEGSRTTTSVVSCSFYDHKLHLWKA
jgi:diphthamide biosynthesis protein 7